MSDNEVGERLQVIDETCRQCANVRIDHSSHRCSNDLMPNQEYFQAAAAAEYAAGLHNYNGQKHPAAHAPPCAWFVRRRQA